MKRGILQLIGILITLDTFANVNFIDISKISSDSKHVTAFKYIKNNQEYYNHWSNEWSYSMPKEEFIKKLQEYYSSFSEITGRNSELSLLLGDISHFLYNLDDPGSFDLAVKNYTSAIEASPKDYRCYWFLGNHFALANVPVRSIENFRKAEELLPIEQPSEFWNDYAWATALTNMPSHCIYAMDKVKSISGMQGSLENQLGETIHKRIISVDKDKSYKKEEIWTARQGEKLIFKSRPLGLKILVDSSWNLSIYDYSNHAAAFIINPPILKNKNGKEIHYTIAIIMKTANSNDALDDYINNFVSKYPNKSKIQFSKKYDKMIAYEIKDETLYQDIGGGHLYMLGIERSSPKYPGLLLEDPEILPKSSGGPVSYYRPADCKDRFEGKIFYAIMLDSCEDINEESVSIFRTLFEDQITIE